MTSGKQALLTKIRSELRAALDRLSRAATEAHAAATDPGSKAEGKYDTRSLEASYLAVGQAKQVDELAAAVRIFDALVLPDFEADDGIDAGALVEVEMEGELSWFLLVPTAGGTVVSHDGMEVTLLTPASALYQKLVGLRCYESLDAPPLTVTDVI
ncbi:MAG: transcription elongation factor GreAB [Verrucomicrobiota bacterium]